MRHAVFENHCVIKVSRLYFSCQFGKWQARLASKKMWTILPWTKCNYNGFQTSFAMPAPQNQNSQHPAKENLFRKFSTQIFWGVHKIVRYSWSTIQGEKYKQSAMAMLDKLEHAVLSALRVIKASRLSQNRPRPCDHWAAAGEPGGQRESQLGYTT